MSINLSSLSTHFIWFVFIYELHFHQSKQHYRVCISASTPSIKFHTRSDFRRKLNYAELSSSQEFFHFLFTLALARCRAFLRIPQITSTKSEVEWEYRVLASHHEWVCLVSWILHDSRNFRSLIHRAAQYTIQISCSESLTRADKTKARFAR